MPDVCRGGQGLGSSRPVDRLDADTAPEKPSLGHQ